ncbi:MAG: type II toxin-antitoxin system RelE/ParE family toxin [Candidatus Hydrogenedentes bacterium]|nr:type II toxin-antitoxin system RelE/ParE family toxin [Candidatus Hydrogenedentota bacterium]
MSNHIHDLARRRPALLAAVESLDDLKARKGLGFHALKRERRGKFAIKINDQYRICFVWMGKNAIDVEIIVYH